MVVQHNLTAMNSNRMLGVTTGAQKKSSEKLSSGYKINRAADDAAGLSISEKMRRQIRGLTQASANAEDGISAVQTAEGALNEVHDMLQRMNELANKAANGTNSKTDRQSIQDEISQLNTEIDRVSETTKFNELYLMKGGAGTKDIKVNSHDAGIDGTLSDQGDKATFTLKLATDSDISVASQKYHIYDENTDTLEAIQNQIAAANSVTINGTTYKRQDGASTLNPAAASAARGAASTLTQSANGLAASAMALRQSAATLAASAITVETSAGNIRASVKTILASAKILEASAATLEACATMKKACAQKISDSADLKLSDAEYRRSQAESLEDEADDFEVAGNAQEAARLRACAAGLKASAAALEASAGALQACATTKQGSANEIMGSVDKKKSSVELKKASAEIKTTCADAKETCANMKKACAALKEACAGKVKESSDKKLARAAEKIAIANKYSGVNDGVTRFEVNGKQYNVEELKAMVVDGAKVGINGKEARTAVDLENNKNNKTVAEAKALVRDALIQANRVGVDNPEKVVVTAPSETGVDDEYSYTIKKGTITVANDLNFNLHVGADADLTNKIGVDISVMNSKYLGVQDLQVVDDTGNLATYAIDAIEDAITKVNEQRSALGAVQNRLEHTIKNVDNVVENTTAAESQIRDTDMASEMVRYSNNNILMQAGQSMLAQANQSNQGVLSLLG